MQQTHYDTLKVSRDAPIEVIRAAYRVLSQKYHPDRNPADSAAAETMGLLNNAYEILSDPERRHAHDAWIRSFEAEALYVQTQGATPSRLERANPEQSAAGEFALTDRAAVPHLRRFGLLYGIALLVSGVAVVSTVVHRPRENPWLVAAPASEDREALIRRLASEVMMRSSDDAKTSAADPQPSDSVPMPAEDPPLPSAVPAKRAPVNVGDDAARPRQAARAAALPDERTRSSPDLPADVPPNADSQPPIVRPAPPNHIQAPGEPLPEETVGEK